MLSFVIMIIIEIVSSELELELQATYKVIHPITIS